VKELAVALHDKDLKLIISIPPKSSDTLPKYLAGYDYTALGDSIDYFQA
jgi:spore germination protein YaaH